MKYIYMAEDNIYAPLCDSNDTVLFKVGQTKHPQIRRGQLKQAGRRVGITNPIHLTIAHYVAEVPEDMASLVEAYVLHRVKLMPSTQVISREFVYISYHDREECYNSLAKWVEEALTAVPRHA